ncbi:MAG: DapH/DapD/GlmU-related protein [Candidatus Nanohaloarchaea archaeon]
MTRELDVRRHEVNALRRWQQHVHPARVAFNIFFLTLSKYLPLRIKNVLLRALDLNIGKDSATGFGVTFDILFPEKISIGENTTLGYGTTILAHETTQDEFRTGDVDIGDNVLIGANTTVLPGVTIGDGATVSANSLVNRDVEPGEFVGGVPVRNLDEDSI